MYFLPSLVCLQLASKWERRLDVSDWSKKVPHTQSVAITEKTVKTNTPLSPRGNNYLCHTHILLWLLLTALQICWTARTACVSWHTRSQYWPWNPSGWQKQFFHLSSDCGSLSAQLCGGCPWPAGWQSCTETLFGWWLAEGLMGEGWGHFLCGGQQTQGWPAGGSQHHEEIAHGLLPALWWSCVDRSGLKERWSLDEIKTQKRGKWTLFIRTKWNMQIFRVINPLYQATKWYLTIKWWKMRWRAKPLICFQLSYVVFMSNI